MQTSDSDIKTGGVPQGYRVVESRRATKGGTVWGWKAWRPSWESDFADTPEAAAALARAHAGEPSPTPPAPERLANILGARLPDGQAYAKLRAWMHTQEARDRYPTEAARDAYLDGWRESRSSTPAAAAPQGAGPSNHLEETIRPSESLADNVPGAHKEACVAAIRLLSRRAGLADDAATCEVVHHYLSIAHAAPSAPQGGEDRSEPPPGYVVDGAAAPYGAFAQTPPGRAAHGEHETREEAVAACWTHYDQVTAAARREADARAAHNAKEWAEACVALGQAKRERDDAREEARRLAAPSPPQEGLPPEVIRAMREAAANIKLAAEVGVDEGLFDAEEAEDDHELAARLLALSGSLPTPPPGAPQGGPADLAFWRAFEACREPGSGAAEIDEFRRHLAIVYAPRAEPASPPHGEPARPHHLVWSVVEWVDDRCGCRYHPDDDRGTHGGPPHVHRCEKHSPASPPPPGGPEPTDEEVAAMDRETREASVHPNDALRELVDLVNVHLESEGPCDAAGADDPDCGDDDCTYCALARWTGDDALGQAKRERDDAREEARRLAAPSPPQGGLAGAFEDAVWLGEYLRLRVDAFAGEARRRLDALARAALPKVSAAMIAHWYERHGATWPATPPPPGGPEPGPACRRPGCERPAQCVESPRYWCWEDLPPGRMAVPLRPEPAEPSTPPGDQSGDGGAA